MRKTRNILMGILFLTVGCMVAGTASAEYWRVGQKYNDTTTDFFCPASDSFEYLGESNNATVYVEFKNWSTDSLNQYFVFPFPAEERMIESAKYRVHDRSGTWINAGPITAELTLEIFNPANHTGSCALPATPDKTASIAATVWSSTVANTWYSFTLSSTPSDLAVDTDELLVVHVQYNKFTSGASEGLSDYFWISFEITLSNGPTVVIGP
ncbi:MAG: hypothetical protein GY864_14830 [Desulfobacterales bacterium]|nr:hypothetical protein [Desulfobacterales bacterium]